MQAGRQHPSSSPVDGKGKDGVSGWNKSKNFTLYGFSKSKKCEVLKNIYNFKKVYFL